MYTDPIADMLTRIRNALRIERVQVDMPYSKLKAAVAAVLEREGYIRSSERVKSGGVQDVLRVHLKYGPDGEQVIQHIQRVSRPGRRIYRGIDDVQSVIDGLGIFILTTNKGVLSDREAREARVGGELLAEVW